MYIVREGKYGYEIRSAKAEDTHAVCWEMAVRILVDMNNRSKA